ncbi:MAG: glycoside hydrolase family 3 N-terminal domain-containing protein [Lachnospiraceae bacterium]|nr:glycoside hydrolase family 3 N-terminal domain-containing protein [Lachnospiraceae bacterium]
MKLLDHEKKHIREMRRGAAGCTLFLKRNGDFPLEKPTAIGLYGNGARHTLKGGTGSGDVNSRFFVTAEKGLTRAGFTVTTKGWMDEYDQVKKDNHQLFVKRVKEAAVKSGMNPIQYAMGKIEPDPEYDIPTGSGEVAVYVLSRVCGEGTDRQGIRGDFLLTKTEISDILQLKADYEKFMLVLNVGGPVDLSPVADAVDNILLLSQLGAVTGVVLADILLGKTDPSGKLSASWVSWNNREQVGEFAEKNNTRYGEGIYVGYRYYETEGVKPLFPFGYGKSYTDFKVTPKDASLDDGILTVNAKVKNTGSLAGREVVEVYASLPDERLDQPLRVLAGFIKTPVIDAGREKSVSVKVDLRDIACFDEAASAYIIPAGDTLISVGERSDEVKTVCVLRTDDDVKTKQVRNALGETDFTDFIPKKRVLPDDAAEAQVIELTQDDIECLAVNYDQPDEIDETVKDMSDEELAKFSVGAYKDNTIGSVIGAAGQKVPGSAGETFEEKDKGIRGLVMADGPAGLRLDRKYGVDQDGTYSYGNPMMNSLYEFGPKVVQVLPGIQLKNAQKRTERGGQIKYQFATAIPIGTAIAQSWDSEFAEACGDVVGSEMEIYGVDIWLAPALNIQRDIRCGRNFEYYSEDPLISGYMAAAITNGVQKHEGRYTTIKHFAANNQETNRMVNNSCASERALREIYLRGFEIAVRQSQPGFVMSSYNLINGTHTSERKDLMTDILRREFGFKGVLMTDWVVPGMSEKNSQWRYPEPAKVADAGTTLFMPGSRHDYEDILTGLELGTVTREQLEINVSRLIRIAKN